MVMLVVAMVVAAAVVVVVERYERFADGHVCCDSNQNDRQLVLLDASAA